LNPRAEELLVERALRPLDQDEQWELEELNSIDDDSFDKAAAAIVIATSAAESLPQHLAAKILAAAPQPDLRRTLPGVIVQPPESNLPRDTMVGVDIASLAPEPTPERSIQEIVIPEPGDTGPIPTREPVVTFSARAVIAQPVGLSRHAVTAPPPEPTRLPRPASQPEVPSTDHLGTIPPARDGNGPQPYRAPSQPPADQPQPFPRTPQPYPSQGTGPQLPIAHTPQPQPFVQQGPLPLDTQRQAMRGIPLPTETLPPGEAPPIVAPIIDLSARRGQPAMQPKRRSVLVPWLAAAACLLVAGGAVWWALQRETGDGKVAAVAPPPPSPEVARTELLALPDTTKITWTATQDATSRGATGDLVWNQSRQTGFMRFVGLTPNDPKQFQYQLWIFDKNRDQAFPVDGGVFDVSSTGEVLVRISPKLAVNDATLFAVTVEKPGGVVVSKRERIVVTAARS